MPRIVVVGLCNCETTASVEGFPVAYDPVRYPFFGLGMTVSGVGFNVAAALVALGDDVRLLSLVGRDAAGDLVRARVRALGLPDAYVLRPEMETAQSVILYDSGGRRMILTDLKDQQDRAYPEPLFRQALDGAAMAVVCNVNYARPLLRAAQAVGVPLATDVHAVSALDDPYNADFMAAADVLFMSHERLPEEPFSWAQKVMHRYGPDLLVVGLGASGALLVCTDGSWHHESAWAPRGVVNTVGAGDALFAAFVHAYAVTGDPRLALRRAVVFAGHKIGSSGGAQGFLSAPELEALAGARAGTSS